MSSFLLAFTPGCLQVECNMGCRKDKIICKIASAFRSLLHLQDLLLPLVKEYLKVWAQRSGQRFDFHAEAVHLVPKTPLTLASTCHGMVLLRSLIREAHFTKAQAHLSAFIYRVVPLFRNSTASANVDFPLVAYSATTESSFCRTIGFAT